MMTDAEYFGYELARVGAYDEHDEFRIKITSAKGETRWLTITPEQYRDLALLLTTEPTPDRTF